MICLIARRFDISTAYKELDREADKKGMKIGRVRKVDGERAYQVGKGEPSAFLPCRVREAVVRA